MINIKIYKQILEHFGKTFPISTAKNGIGEMDGSYCTPTGKFKIFKKIGAYVEPGSVFIGRNLTGEIYNTDLSRQYPERDWILSRILWLDGVEEHNKNTKERYIYIHGSPDEVPMSVPGSKGCIRMHNSDVIELFDKIIIGEEVNILES
jgi:L,D-transpeptidase YbiS